MGERPTQWKASKAQAKSAQTRGARRPKSTSDPITDQPSLFEEWSDNK
jgi:hypothetical protein